MANITVVDIEGLAKNWWAVLLRGIAGLIFGLITFFEPGISLAVLVLAFGAYAFAGGVLMVVSAVRRRGSTDRWWLLVMEGIVGILAGIATLVLPGVTALALLYLIAAWALVTGVLEVGAAIRLRKVIAHEWLLALSGAASVLLGVVLVMAPGAGAVALVIWIGAYAFVAGALLVGLGLRLRSLNFPGHPPHATQGLA
jgi:uncharacterized membrane protein HdeD (DUF308 family)